MSNIFSLQPKKPDIVDFISKSTSIPDIIDYIKELSDNKLTDDGVKIVTPPPTKQAMFNTTTAIGSLTPHEIGLVNALGKCTNKVSELSLNISNTIPRGILQVIYSTTMIQSPEDLTVRT